MMNCAITPTMRVGTSANRTQCRRLPVKLVRAEATLTVGLRFWSRLFCWYAGRVACLRSFRLAMMDPELAERVPSLTTRCGAG